MLTGYLIAVNLVAFILMGIDKQNARKSARRVPEKVLFLFTIIGGSIGSIAGMFVFRHKTRHLSFVLGLPTILLLHLIAALLLLS